MIPLDFGESSSLYFEDTDAVVVQEGQEIEGETAGAFKLGGADVDIEDGEGSSIEINRDGEYTAYYVAGRAGYVEPAEYLLDSAG